MHRPRRPVLAASFALVLLATAAMWVRGVRRCDSVYFTFPVQRIWTVRAEGGSLMVASSGGIVPADRIEGPVWQVTPNLSGLVAGDFDLSRHSRTWRLVVPLWAVMPIEAVVVWWFWRGRKEGAGFPVEAVVGEAK